MRLRTRLILGFLLLAAISFLGTAFVVIRLDNLVKNQEMFTFKDRVFHDHHRALGLMQTAQSRLYQHQAGYTRDIDSLINDVGQLTGLLESIPGIYRFNMQHYSCTFCHDDVAGSVADLEDILDRLDPKLSRYKQHISYFLTTSDPESQAIHNERVNVIGEDIIATIKGINDTAALMMEDLFRSNEELAKQAMVTISGIVVFVVIISLSIMAYILYTLHRMMSLLIRGTEFIYSDDFSQRIGTTGRSDEFGLLASRFDLMAEHLQERDALIGKKQAQLEEANISLHDLNENLESRILERTSELEGMVGRYRNTATALEESKHRLESANVDLIKANQAKANFLSIVSHELKTPLSVINGFLSLILDERYQNDPKNLREAVEISKRRGQQLARMIDELIDLSRLDANAMVIHKEPVLVEEAFEDAADQFTEDLQRKQLRLSTLDCSPLPPVNCDPDKFRQIVTNLLSNAIKFSPEGSSIEFRCREEGEFFLFLCRDQGIGIPPGEREKVFDKFYQVDSSATRRFGGAGLGLSIVREIVHLHGGKIWVESDRGQGCTFFFTIPKDGKKDRAGDEEASSPGSRQTPT